PEKTLDGSGLDADGNHTISPESMWFTAPVDLDPWIQYEFDDVQKLDMLKVWNSNSSAEIAIGWGVKDVEIVYSTDGENWDVLEGATQFSRAPGSPTYNQYDEIAFNGAAAKYVRLNIASNWGGILMSYGLSEVQFFQIPVQARTPDPVSGAVDVVPNATVSWRAGREAAQSTIYVGADANAVAEGTAPSITSNTNSVSLSSLNLALGETYYWRVDEVNEVEATSVWAGPVWSLSTIAALVVDDFESYGNVSPDRPFQAWLDGFGYSADEFFPVEYPGNGTGAGIGHDIWSLSSP
ncbi:MAG: discoidin domain-containing protein, partial [Planctomycetes bacterium]|nr:discoidin domain-containing protein [Planctomycetota bacterium]